MANLFTKLWNVLQKAGQKNVTKILKNARKVVHILVKFQA